MIRISLLSAMETRPTPGCWPPSPEELNRTPSLYPQLATSCISTQKQTRLTQEQDIALNSTKVLTIYFHTCLAYSHSREESLLSSHSLFHVLHMKTSPKFQKINLTFSSGCNAVINRFNGTLTSPAFGQANYPHNLKCTYRIRHPEGGKLSMIFSHMDIHPTDSVQVINPLAEI